jgi:hypothetical protein
MSAPPCEQRGRQRRAGWNRWLGWQWQGAGTPLGPASAKSCWNTLPAVTSRLSTPPRSSPPPAGADADALAEQSGDIEQPGEAVRPVRATRTACAASLSSSPSSPSKAAKASSSGFGAKSVTVSKRSATDPKMLRLLWDQEFLGGLFVERGRVAKEVIHHVGRVGEGLRALTVRAAPL